METQEIFNTVVRHLRKQGRKSQMWSSKTCQYRGAEGDKCAVGVLIADEHYSRSLEGHSCRHPVVRNALVKSVGGVHSEEMRLLAALQWCHDFFPVERWEERCGGIAEEFNLDLPSKKE